MIHLLLLAALAAADPPAPTPPPFILPVNPTPVPPPPPPNAPVNLVPGKPYVVRLNSAAVVASPAGLVKLCNKPEPLTLVDADGTDTTYTGDKSVCIVLAKGQGLCELILVSTADGSELARVQLNVGGAPPTPPGPTPPTPTDLTAALQKAYTADGADAAGLASLVALYKVAAASLPARSDLKTNADAIAWIKAAEPGVGLKPTQLAGTRKAIGAELDAALGAATAPLDAAKAGAEFVKVSQALQGVK